MEEHPIKLSDGVCVSVTTDNNFFFYCWTERGLGLLFGGFDESQPKGTNSKLTQIQRHQFPLP